MIARSPGRTAAKVFPFLAGIWLLARFLPAAGAPPPSAVAAVESVQVRALAETGRLGVRGEAGLPGAGAARARLEAEVDAANEDLAAHALRIAGRVQLFPGEDVTGLRLSGLIVPFYDHDAERLRAARESAATRPVEALTAVAEILDARLAEPDQGFTPEASTRRTELTRVFRETRDALEGAEDRARRAGAIFRQDALAAARASEGPFRRRGPLRVLEATLAAVLAACLLSAVRGSRARVPLHITLPAAGVLSALVVLLLEGTDALPVDPIWGVAVRFVPLAVALGLCAAWFLERTWDVRRETLPLRRQATPPRAGAARGPGRPARRRPHPAPEQTPKTMPAAEAHRTTERLPATERELADEAPPPPSRGEPFFSRAPLPIDPGLLSRRRR